MKQTDAQKAAARRVADAKKPKPAASKPVEFKVTRARQFGGVFYAEGDSIFMTEQAARYFLPPIGEGLERVAPKSGKVAEPAS